MILLQKNLPHVEMMGTIVAQLTRGLTKQQIIDSGLDAYYVNHGLGVYPSSAAGVPFSALALQSKGTLLQIYTKIWQQNKSKKHL